ncbi:hypothetical protein GE09DRAFT_1232003 [Coniochaeta sp. 2T2.1]|nr:hypothetical protein GE09DRAFT_1232003 [Coniochaeta sp. 2T2.1]
MASNSGTASASAKNYCATCNTTYKHRTSLARHLRTSAAHAEPSIPCGVAGCGRLFRHKYQLEKHMRSAHGKDSDDAQCDVKAEDDTNQDSKEDSDSETDGESADDAHGPENDDDPEHSLEPDDEGAETRSPSDSDSGHAANYADNVAHADDLADAYDEALQLAAPQNVRLEAEKAVLATERMRVATAYAALAVENSTLERRIREQGEIIARLSEGLDEEKRKHRE